MSLSTSLHELRCHVEDLRLSLAELVMTAREDMPASADVAAADSVAELVTELQGNAEQAAARLGTVTDTYQFPAVLPAVSTDLAALELRYWRDLRSYPALTALRGAVRRRPSSWHRWLRSVELSVQRCEEPLAATGVAVRSASAEIAEILTLYLPRGPAAELDTAPAAPISTPAHRTPAHISTDPISSRRPS